MTHYLFIALFPLMVPWISKLIWPRTIGWGEMVIAGAIGLFATTLVYFAGSAFQTSDVEIWNGSVTAKSKDRVSCSHSYNCNCREVKSCSGSGKDKSCTTSTVCDTCYEHSHDFDWVVHTNIDSDFDIDRIDRQGVDMPPRWQSVQIGDPVSKTHRFTNYVMAVPESLFHANLTHKFDGMIPQYPNKIYDYYKLNRLLTVNVPVPDVGEWNRDIASMLRKLGPQRQANVIVIMVNTPDQSYVHALEGEWIGGKKNDIIVVMGVTTYPKIDWVTISSWTDKALFKVQLRDAIIDIGTVDRPKIINAIEQHTMATFKRKEMADFKYLESQIEPPVWVLILAIVLGVSGAGGVSYYLYRENTPRGRRRSFR